MSLRPPGWLEILESRLALAGADNTASVATHLAFGQQPNSTVVGQVIAPAVTVLAEDEFNQVVTAGAASVAVALNNSPTGAMLGGTTTEAGQNGVATFNDLSVNKPGTGLTLTASVSALPLPALGVTFVENGVTLPELGVLRAAWSASADDGQTSPILGDFVLTVAPSSVEPGLWGHLAADRALDTATVHVRNAAGVEYLTYTLTGVTFSSFQTSTDGAAAPADTVRMHFNRVAESYANPAGGTNIAAFDQSLDENLGAGSLSGTTLATPPAVGVTFVENGVALPELAVTRYAWSGDDGGGSGHPSLQDFSLALAPSSVEPGLWGHLANENALDRATIHVRNATGVEYLTYTLTGVTFSTFQTSTDGGGAPADTVRMHFSRVAESCASPAGGTNIAAFDQRLDENLGAGSLSGTTLATPPAVGVTFVENGVALPELAAMSYAWSGDDGGGSGHPSLQDFSLALAPSSVEPGLWGHLAAGIALSSATVHVRNGAGVEYLTYTLTDVTFSSFQTSTDGGAAPADTVRMHFSRVAESYASPAGGTNSAAFDQRLDENLGAGSLSGTTLATPPAVGVTFVENGVALPELAVTSYAWSGDDGGGSGHSSLQDFSLALAPSSVEPGLWGHLAADRALDRATVHVRNGAGVEYLTYTLTDVTFSSCQTSTDGAAAPADTVRMHFSRVAESYASPAGGTNSAAFDQRLDENLGAGSLSGTTLATPPAVGVTFVENGVALPELAAMSYAWSGDDGGGSGHPSLQDFSLALAPSSVEPGLWGHLAAENALDTATVHVRNAAGLEYLTYTLTGVTFSSFQTSTDGGAAPADAMTLHFNKVEEDYRPLLPDGALGTANRDGFNALENLTDPRGSLAGPAPQTSVVSNPFSVSFAPTSTTLTSSDDPSVYGQTVTFTATVLADVQGLGAPGGSVQFQIDNVNVGNPVQLAGGSARFTTSMLTVTTPDAPHTITAVYSGDADFQGSDNLATAVTQTVEQNLPVLISAVGHADGTTTLRGLFKSMPDTNYRLDFFASPGADGSDSGQGQTFLGAVGVTTDSFGNANYIVTLGFLAPGSSLAATATDLTSNIRVTSPLSNVIQLISHAPTLASISPSATVEGAFTLIVNGGNFASNAVVLLNGTPLATTFINAGQLRAAVPASLAEEATDSITVSNPGSEGGTSSGLPLTVSDAPLSTSGQPLAAAEGSAFAGVVATFADAGGPEPAANYSALVDWGDGSSSLATLAAAGAKFNVLASHAYQVKGVYQATISIVDDGGATAAATSLVTVVDGQLFGMSKTTAFSESAALLLTVASFEDADPKGASGDYTATIDWGDGQTTPGSIAAEGTKFDVSGLHQYASDGNYPITVTVRDVGGANAIIHSTAAVADSLAATPVALNVIGNKNFNGTVAAFSDPDNSKTGSSDYTAAITWDDRTTSSGTFHVQGVGVNATFSVLGNHTFASFSGYHTISVAITDRDDGSVTTVVDTVLDPPGLTGNQIYVLNAYQDAFDAAGDKSTVVAGASLADWATELDARATRASFATALMHSDEYYRLLAGNLYQEYLGRGSDAEGLAFWVTNLQQGMTDEQLEAAFAGAPEFYQHAGGNDAGWVNAMYVDILGRAADAQGLAYWTQRLAQGVDRGAVVQSFASSVEHETQRVNDDYFSDLVRAPDPAGQAYWVNAFEHGLHNEDVIAGFLASDEYYQTHSA